MCTSASMGQDVRPCRGTEDHRVRGKTFSKRTDQGGQNHLTLGITDRKTNVSCNWTKGLTSWRYYRTETENPCHSCRMTIAKGVRDTQPTRPMKPKREYPRLQRNKDSGRIMITKRTTDIPKGGRREPKTPKNKERNYAIELTRKVKLNP